MTAGWRDLAACKGTDLNLFFPVTGESLSAAVAKHVCGGCPVQTECLLEAFGEDNMFGSGVRGGLSFRERRRFRQLLTVGARPHRADCRCPIHGRKAA